MAAKFPKQAAENSSNRQTTAPDKRTAIQGPPTDARLLVELDLARAMPADVFALQQKVGNRAVQRLIQTKLAVGPAGDQYEQEADRVAGQVMTMPAPAHIQPTVQRAGPEEEEEIQTKPLATSITPLVQREAAPEEEEELQAKPLVQREVAPEEEEIQAKPLIQQSEGKFQASADLEDHLAANRGSGLPLPTTVRTFMEPRFGADFSGVRVHTGGEAAQLNRDVSAQAFTHKQDIYLGEGKYNPGTNDGQLLLAHELTHVVQQTGRIQPRIQRWSLMWTGAKGAPAGHEVLTAASLEAAGVRPKGSLATIYGSKTETWLRDKALEEKQNQLKKADKGLEKARAVFAKRDKKTQLALAKLLPEKKRTQLALDKALAAKEQAQLALDKALIAKEQAQKELDDIQAYANFIKGAVWNDDPEQLLGGSGAQFGSGFTGGKSAVEKVEKRLHKAEQDLAQAKQAGNQEAINKAQKAIDKAQADMKQIRLTGRSHEGDLQFLHGMASSLEETAKVTQGKVMLWAEFCYKVATGEIPWDTLVEKVDVKPKQELAGSVSSIKELFPKQGKMKVVELLGAKGQEGKQRALGSLLHMLQDTFCASHSERVAAKRKGEMVSRIKSFRAYPAQESDRHALADVIAQKGTAEESLANTMGAQEAVDAGAGIVQRWNASVGWSAAWGDKSGPERYLQDIFALVPEEATQIDGQQVQVGSGKAGAGRSFRKSVHKEYYGMLTSVAPSVRPITAASKAYDDMLLYQSTALTPEQAKAKKNLELAQAKKTLQCIADWEPQKENTKEKNRQAVAFLKLKMQEDERMILEEIADIDNALKTH
jgi:hypothetical protein